VPLLGRVVVLLVTAAMALAHRDFGIWPLVVLCRHEVIAAFRDHCRDADPAQLGPRGSLGFLDWLAYSGTGGRSAIPLFQGIV
jgi:hypothetical protein